MKTILVSDIVISPQRQRREFNPKTLQELVEDIRENGLFNALVLREHEEYLVDEPELKGSRIVYRLCQGERRLRAIQDLWSLSGQLRYDGQLIPEGQVPYVTLGDLNPLQAEIAELSENTRREDLTWQERAAATSRIMQLRSDLALETGDAPPPVSAIAKEIRGSSEGIHHEMTRREIIVSKHLSDPDVQAAKGLDEAYKVLKRKEIAKRNVELAETVGRTFTVDSHQIIHGDALDWLSNCPDEAFDVILTDPPYGMGADTFGDSGVTGQRLGMAEHGYADDEATFYQLLTALSTESIRITKPQAHLYCFCDIDRFGWLKESFSRSGWWVHRTPLIWHKPNALRVPWPEHGPRRSHELILYAVKGKRPVTQVCSDVITCTQEDNLGHPAQKPVALFADLLRRSARPGDTILDPFAGSGPLLPAAHGLRCIATLVEQDASSYGIILNRAKALRSAEEMELSL